jgi:NAD(P)-dependent dehydrogenase (short-subunit alcohol dehydrogenase family)
MNRLAGKLALVTGGNSGIGLATAQAFVAEGARVAITGRDAQTLETARNSLGEGHLAIQSDAADVKAIDALFATVKQQFGALDVMFLNAGVGTGGSIESTTEEDFARIFDINVKGVFFAVQKALPLLRNGASIVLNSSIAPRTGRPGLSVYAASKAAVRTFARNFSSELAPRGIRVNVVSPGPIETPIWYRGDPEVATQLRDRVAASVPLGRLGKAEEVAAAVVFLASDESSFIVGTEITVDGGVTELLGARPVRRE